MSQVVLLSTSIGIPQNLDDLVAQVAQSDPAFAEWLTEWKQKGGAVALIRECAQKAVAFMLTQPGIQSASAVLDYFGNPTAVSEEIIKIIKTNDLPIGFCIAMSKSGELKFYADDFKSDWKSETKRLGAMFLDAYNHEIARAALMICGYEIEIDNTVRSSDGVIVHHVEGAVQEVR